MRSASEDFDQPCAGVHAATRDVDVVALVVEHKGRGGDDLEIADAADAAVVDDGFGFLREGCGLTLLLVRQRAERRFIASPQDAGRSAPAVLRRVIQMDGG